jgi:MscS family membrane protein
MDAVSMKPRFETLFRCAMALLLLALIWSIWVSAQEADEPDPDAVMVEEETAGEAMTPRLTFGLDRIEWLGVRLLNIPLYQYVASVIYVILAFYLAKLLDFLVSGRLSRWVEKSPGRVNAILAGFVRGPTRVVAFVILLHVGLQLFPWPAWLQELLSKGLLVVVAISLTYLALKMVDLFMGYWQQQAAAGSDPVIQTQLFPLLTRSVQIFVVIVAVLVTAQNLGVNITGLIASLSIGGLALGLAAQDTLANLFGAVAILMDKPFRVGDRVQVDNVDGVVEGIGFRSTQVRNLDGHLVTVPNKAMGNATITNISRRPNIRTLINIGITYDTPTAKVKEALAIVSEVYRSHPMTHDVWISFNRFADFALNIFVVHWWKSTVFKDYLAGFQEMNLELKQKFDEAGIQFAFPTQTVHLKQGSDWRVGPESISPTAGELPPE